MKLDAPLPDIVVDELRGISSELADAIRYKGFYSVAALLLASDDAMQRKRSL